MNKLHHEFGMSRWPALLDCACFEGIENNKDADFGTGKHEMFAHFLEQFKQGVECDEPEDLHSRGAYVAAKQIVETIKGFDGDMSCLHIEERVDITHGLLKGVFGTADAYYADDEGRVFVWDFKTFYNPSRDYTAQLVGYAFAVAEKVHYALTRESTIYIGICYGDHPSKNHTEPLTVDDVFNEMHNIYKVHADIRDGKARPTQCGWCELCKNKASCFAFREVAKSVMNKPDLVGVVEKWSDLTIERKAQLGVIAEAVSKWVDGVREAMKADLLAGGNIEDKANGIKYVLRHTSGRKTPRPVDAWAMLTSRGVDSNAIKEKLSISASAVKDLLKSVGVKGKAADALVEDVSNIGNGSVAMVRG